MKHQAWNVYKKGKKVDTVFFDKDLDKDYVLDSLIEHDNYAPDITVRKDNIPGRQRKRHSYTKTICNSYGIEPGRAIVCKDAGRGRGLFSICKDEGFSPTEADAMAHYIADTLNKKKDFDRYYRKYMK